MATKQFCDVCGKEVDNQDFLIAPIAPKDYEQRFYKPKAHLALRKYRFTRITREIYGSIKELDICWPCVRDAIDKAYPRGEK